MSKEKVNNMRKHNIDYKENFNEEIKNKKRFSVTSLLLSLAHGGMF